ncbi:MULTISPECIES: type II toxin-antitoxin system RelE/ParE family toxin [Eubacterium]|uniref:Toxin ParE1/3/4 n=1 Tax=Eubacterium barkeri TaxID=1528 RepID=A0A1H3DXJ6_EUBBA|nr:type II toxin-antitoxin system RelE/ParE family toxin [Eubacterium barkeri]SDX71193.1 toxin ParE1/3/4 [Eubacterium barkeri]
MSYKLRRTDTAEEQIRRIIFYIADSSGDSAVALRYLDRLEEAIHRLENYPYSGSYPRYSILKKQGYRVLIIGNHLVFYKVFEAEKTVMIYAVVDARQEYRHLI